MWRAFGAYFTRRRKGFLDDGAASHRAFARNDNETYC
jgi:hypothetical protein